MYKENTVTLKILGWALMKLHTKISDMLNMKYRTNTTVIGHRTTTQTLQLAFNSIVLSASDTNSQYNLIAGSSIFLRRSPPPPPPPPSNSHRHDKPLSLVGARKTHYRHARLVSDAVQHHQAGSCRSRSRSSE